MVKRSRLPVPRDAHRPLSTWVHGGKMFVKSFFHYENEVIIPEMVFISIDTFYRVHEAPFVPLKTLEQSWTDTKEYIVKACTLINRDRTGHPLSVEERTKVLAHLGEPPGPASPFYVITVGEAPEERIVYVGKTNAATHRFAAGHTATTALHHPKYDGLTKRLYLAAVTLVSDERNYVPLEWLHPKAQRDALWSEIEQRIIYHFQPELNERLKARMPSKQTVDVAIHNYSGTKSFDATYI
jgi:hypothetical protein